MQQSKIQFSTVSPEELRALEAQAQTPTPPASKPATIMDFVREIIKNDRALPPGLQGILKGIVGGSDFITNPENRSTLAAIPGGLVGGAIGGATVGGPVGAVGGAMIGAGTAAFGASKYGEGKSTGEAIKEGAAEAMFEPVGGGVRALATPFKSLSRRFTNAALTPGKDVLDKLIDPATGQKFGNYEDAARHFGERALTIQPTGTPARASYAKGLQESNSRDQDLLQWLLNWDPQIRVPDADLTPVGTWNRLARDLTERGTVTDPSRALGQADDIANSILSRTRTIPGAASASTNMPMALPPTRQTEWSLPQLDQLQKGLQDDLRKFYDRKASAGIMGQKVPADDELEARVMEILRGNASDAIKANAPQFPDVPTVADLQSRISERIPYTQAAVDATYDVAGGSPPRARMAGSQSGLPKVTWFSYASKKAGGKAARPFKALGDAAPVASHAAPGLTRLLAALMSTHGKGDR